MPPRRKRAEARNLRLMIETRGASPDDGCLCLDENEHRLGLGA
jgi:hypothetical protein